MIPGEVARPMEDKNVPVIHRFSLGKLTFEIALRFRLQLRTQP